MLIDIKSIENLIAMVGQTIYLCQAQPISGDSNYGLPDTAQMTRRRIKGYLAPKSVLDIAIAQGNNKIASYTGYILNTEIQPSDITFRTFLEMDGILYQIEQTEPIRCEGVVIIYKLDLARKILDIGRLG